MKIKKMNTQRALIAPLTALLAAHLTACVGGGSTSSGGAEAGTEAGAMIAGVEAGTEAGIMVAGVEAGTEAGTEAGVEAGTEAGMEQAWRIGAHPCVGSRTDALHCDDERTCFVGCGTTTEGRGVFVTDDGGESWSAVVTNPQGFLEDSRVNDISRSSDGMLYFAGDLPNSAGVVKMDADGNLSEVFQRYNTSGFNFTPGSFRRAESGRAVAESLTGNDIVYRAEDSDDPERSWMNGYGFWRDGDADDFEAGVQLLALDSDGDNIFGVGSTINSPNMVFLPKEWGENIDFNIVQFNNSGLGAFDGELWDIEVKDRVIVGGVNQSAGEGVIYTGVTDPNLVDPANWRFYRVSAVIPDQATWVMGVCQSDEGELYAVGRESREEWGFVLRSTDGGESFTNITPLNAEGASAIPDASRCVVKNGVLMVAGANGFFASLSVAAR